MNETNLSTVIDKGNEQISELVYIYWNNRASGDDKLSIIVIVLMLIVIAGWNNFKKSYKMKRVNKKSYSRDIQMSYVDYDEINQCEIPTHWVTYT